VLARLPGQSSLCVALKPLVEPAEHGLHNLVLLLRAVVIVASPHTEPWQATRRDEFSNWSSRTRADMLR
jgi:hypothetical protein